MNKNIQDYSFVDCVIVDFFIDKTANSVEIVSEAYYPSDNINIQRKKGRIRIRVEQLIHVAMDIDQEFQIDILKKYSLEGEDTKSNEVYLIQITSDEKKVHLELDSDFLKLSAVGKMHSILDLD